MVLVVLLYIIGMGKTEKSWEGSDQHKWSKKVKPRWGYISVNSRGYLYHHFKQLKYSKSLGHITKFKSERQIRTKVKKCDNEIGRLIGGRSSIDKTIGNGLDQFQKHNLTRLQNGRITRQTHDTYLTWIRFHERGIFKNHHDTPLVRFETESNLQSIRDFFWKYFKKRTQLKGQKGKRLTDRTILKEIGRLDMFFRFLVNENLMKTNPFDVIGDWLKSNVKSLTPLHDDQITKREMVQTYELWKRVRKGLVRRWDQTKFHRSRQKRVFLIQSLTGMRVSEVSRMEWGEVGFETPLVRDVRTIVLDGFTELEISSKGKTRTRTVPSKVSEILKYIRDELLEEFGSLPRWVHPSPHRHYNDPELTQPMTISSLIGGFISFQQSMGEEPPFLRTHQLRQFFITDLIERGVPDREVSIYVRHSSLNMTRYYLREDVLTTHNVLTDLEKSLLTIEDG